MTAPESKKNVDEVDVVSWRWRRDAGTPGTTARRRRRGGPGAPSGRSDLSMEAPSDGNGDGEVELGAVAARVRFCGRHRAREREASEGEQRGARGAPYPRARRLGRDGIVVERGWSDRAGRRNRGRRRP